MTSCLTFYGHFSGRGSYPIVCHALARHLELEGVEHDCIDLRQWGARAPLSRGPALLFGFPSWWSDIGQIAQHSGRVGYHVCDVLPAPSAWADAINEVDLCLTASEWCRAVLLASGVSTPIHVVRHGVPAAMRLAPPPPEEDRQTLVHFCSSPHPDRKGTYELIAAFEQLKRGKLRIYTASAAVIGRAGASSRSADIEIVSEEHVDSQLEQVARFTRAACVVQPSRAEGFGMIAVEALASGVPVVATTCTGHSETLTAYPPTPGLVPVSCGGLMQCSGGVAPAVEIDELAMALQIALDNLEPLRAEAVANRQALIAANGWDAVLASLLYVLGPVLS